LEYKKYFEQITKKLYLVCFFIGRGRVLKYDGDSVGIVQT